MLSGLLLFYAKIYSVHQDLAGSALSGRLAVTLGASFREYSMYFPPVEQAWFSIATWLSDASGTRLDLVVVLMTGVAVLFSTSFAYWIRRTTTGASPLFLVLSTALLVVLPVLYKNVFGLREHLVVLGLWPYLVLRVSDPEGTRIGWRVRAILGLWMGATLLFKYLYSVVVLLVEAADAVVQRRPVLLFRIENVVAGAVVALYLLAWLGLHPDQREVIANALSAIDANLADPQTNWTKAAMHLSFAIFFYLAFRMFNLPVRLSVLGFALALGAVIVPWVQERWYSHHLYPITMAYIAWWWMVGRPFKAWTHVLLVIYVFLATATQFRDNFGHQARVGELTRALDDAGLSVAGKRVGILTMHPTPYNQYFAAHGALRWNASMNNSYVAAELAPFDRPENARIAPPPVTLRDPGRRRFHDEMLRLWEDMPPDVLIIDHSWRFPLQYIDVELDRVFSRDRRFNAIMRHYRPVLVHDGRTLEFKYYVRAD